MPGPAPRPAPVSVPQGSKYCWHCHTPKPVSAFASDPCRGDGLRRMCRECDGSRRKAQYLAKKAATVSGAVPA